MSYARSVTMLGTVMLFVLSAGFAAGYCASALAREYKPDPQGVAAP